MVMVRAVWLGAFVACGPKLPGEMSAGTGSEVSTGAPVTSGAPTTSGATTSADVTSTTGSEGTTSGSSSGGVPFIPIPDANPDWCDIFAQDCPEGQKCAPVSLDGDNALEDNRCVPVVADPDRPGEPCTLLGTGVDGLDTCEEGSMCYWIDPQTKIGTCTSHCLGDPRASFCPPAPVANCWGTEQLCYIAADGALTLCLRTCDPLLHDCPGGGHCQHYEGFVFGCFEGDQDVPFAAACSNSFECAAGSLCGESDVAVECDPNVTGCCTPFCDLADPAPCPGVGQVCVPFEQDDASQVCENLGVCRLPP